MSTSKVNRRRVLEGLVAAGTYSLLPGYVKAVPGSPASGAAAAGGGTTTGAVSVTVGSSTGIALNPTGGVPFVGLSYEKAELIRPFFNSGNTGLLNLFKLLGPGVLRIGGDSVDNMTYVRGSGSGGTWPDIANADIDRFAGFFTTLDATCNWKILYGVNLAEATSTLLASDEVQYLANHFTTPTASILGYELGNEPDAWASTHPTLYGVPPLTATWDVTQFEAKWEPYQAAVSGRISALPATGTAGGNLTSWNVPFNEHEGSKNSLLTDHYYKDCTSPKCGTPSPTGLVQYPNHTLATNLGYMRGNTGGQPFRLAETNSVAGGDPGVSDVLASALWSINFMFDCAFGGAQGVNFHGGATANYAPIQDNGTNVTAVMPLYYGMLLFSKLGSGVLYNSTPSNPLGGEQLTAFVVKSTHYFNVVLTNTSDTAMVVTVNLPTGTSILTCISYTLAGDGVNGLSSAAGTITLGGSTVTTSGVYSPSAPVGAAESASGNVFTVTVQPYTAKLVESRFS